LAQRPAPFGVIIHWRNTKDIHLARPTRYTSPIQ
jgi:hypothetical protein